VGVNARLASFIAQQGVVTDSGVLTPFEEQLGFAFGRLACALRHGEAMVLEGVVAVHDQHQLAVRAGKVDALRVEQLIEVGNDLLGLGLVGHGRGLHS